MKLTTVSKARMKGILREGDAVDLTNVLNTSLNRITRWYNLETGSEPVQTIESRNLKWLYLWNSATMDYILLGLPNKDSKMSFGGKTGFMQGNKLLNSTVNKLYGANEIGIYGRHISEIDYYGLLDNFGNHFREILHEEVDINTIFTATPFTHISMEKGAYCQIVNYGFKKINIIKMNLTNPDLSEYVYQLKSTINDDGDILFDRNENVISTPLFPILFGKIEDLLVDISDISQRKTGWILYPPETENVNSDE